MSHLVAARTVERAFRSVRRSKTPMDSQERSEKRGVRHRHGMVLDRFRAEYKIRVKRRLVRRTQIFKLTYLARLRLAARSALARRFVVVESDESEPEPGLSQVGKDRVRASGLSIARPSPPFRWWWAYWKRPFESCGCLFVYQGRGRSNPSTAEAFGHLEVPSWGLQDGAEESEPPDLRRWELPEALGGVHLELERSACGNESHAGRFRKKVFTWDFSGSQVHYDMVFNVHGRRVVPGRSVLATDGWESRGRYLPLDFYESNPGFASDTAIGRHASIDDAVWLGVDFAVFERAQNEFLVSQGLKDEEEHVKVWTRAPRANWLI